MGRLRTMPVIALCGLYLFLAAGVALLSSSVYRAIEEASGQHSNQRIALSYLVSQLRAGDTAGGVQVGSYGDGDALFLRDGDYETILYCYEGSLMERYAERGLGLTPDAGTPVTQLDSLTVTLKEGVLQLQVLDSAGERGQVLYALQSHTGEVSP